MKEEVRHFDIHGLCLEVRAEDGPLALPFDTLLGRYASQRRGPACFDVAIRYGGDVSPGLAERFSLYSRGVMPDGLVIAHYIRGTDDRQIVIEGRARTTIDLAARKVLLEIVKGQERRPLHGCLIPVLVEIGTVAGHNVIHSACLASGGPDGLRAVLATGASGAGKTTATLALARAGMEFLADDTTFVTEAEGRPAVWGLRLPCKVRPRTLELLPWLMALPRRPATVKGEWIIDTAALWPPRKLIAEPRAILFIDQWNERGHVLTSIDKVDAVALLTNAGVRAADPRGEGPAGRAFRTFARLVARCDTYRLSAGPDLASLVDAVTPLLK